MNCTTCEAPERDRHEDDRSRPSGVTKCHRLECGHAWHMTTPAGGDPGPSIVPTSCGCGEIVTVNGLLVAGRRLAGGAQDVSDEAFREWSKQVLEALDGIPAESGAPSLARSAATAAKSSMSTMPKKIVGAERPARPRDHRGVLTAPRQPSREPASR